MPAWFTLGPLGRVSSWAALLQVFEGPNDDYHFWEKDSSGTPDYALCTICAALAYWVLLFFFLFTLARCSPSRLNYCLRFCVLYFNVTYPINASMRPNHRTSL